MAQPIFTRTFSYRITPEQDAELQLLAAMWGTSQNQAIMRAIREALEREGEKEENK